MKKIQPSTVISVSPERLNMEDVPMDDQKCFKKLNELDVFGIFQFETNVAKGVIGEIGIDCFDDMYAATTLGRPDPLSGNLHVTYGRRKRGEEYWEPIEAVSDVLDQSYNLPIYQESCCVGDTIVRIVDGQMKLKDIVENEDINFVECVNDDGDLVVRKILQRHKPGKKEVFKLTLDNGKSITCTEDHKILTSNRGFVRSKFLTEEDDIVCV